MGAAMPGTTTLGTITLGPVLFNWDAEQWRDFHFRMADEAPIASACVGEVVCAKRAQFFAPYLGAVCERYKAAGKEVVYATPALATSAAELKLAHAAVEAADEFLIEASDIGVLRLLAGRPHAVGPLVNVYNEDTLAVLAGRGAIRFCLTPELPARSLAALAAGAAALDPAPELEVTVFGRVPLALSARCYHARAKGLHKDNCEFVCADDPDGLYVETLDEEAFLVVNGTQVMSETYLDLLGELPLLRAMAIDRFRLMPHSCDMVEVAHILRDVLDDKIAHDEGRARLRSVVGGNAFSNGFFRDREGVGFEASPNG